MAFKACENSEEIVKQALWLAWQAAGSPWGLGLLRDKPEATKEDVWQNAITSGDYAININRPGSVYADYVFGRMLKLGLRYDKSGITFPETTPQCDYQAWCVKYPTYGELLDAAEVTHEEES